MSKGLIFDIKRYSINDGPGIRTTVFFKGCPLQCRWCHNPEGQSFTPEVMVRSARCLKDCSECLAVCPEGALSKSGAILALDRIHCTACGECAEMCPTQAIEIVGRRLSPAELLREIEKDRVFHEESGGGVTFSGGEPLSQPDFLDEVLDLCRKKEIHAAVDTCGLAAPDVLERIAAQTELFLFDLKTMDEQRHIAFTGESNRLVLENLKRLAAMGKKIIVRIPVVPVSMTTRRTSGAPLDSSAPSRGSPRSASFLITGWVETNPGGLKKRAFAWNMQRQPRKAWRESRLTWNHAGSG